MLFTRKRQKVWMSTLTKFRQVPFLPKCRYRCSLNRPSLNNLTYSTQLIEQAVTSPDQVLSTSIVGRCAPEIQYFQHWLAGNYANISWATPISKYSQYWTWVKLKWKVGYFSNKILLNNLLPVTLFRFSLLRTEIL